MTQKNNNTPALKDLDEDELEKLANEYLDNLGSHSNPSITKRDFKAGYKASPPPIKEMDGFRVMGEVEFKVATFIDNKHGEIFLTGTIYELNFPENTAKVKYYNPLSKEAVSRVMSLLELTPKSAAPTLSKGSFGIEGKEYSEAEVLELIRQVLYNGTPEYYEKGGVNGVINFPKGETFAKAKRMFEKYKSIEK